MAKLNLILKYIKKTGIFILKIIKNFNEDIDSHMNHYYFVIIMFLITIFTYLIYLIFKDVLSNNFGEPQWISLKILIYSVFLLIAIFLGIQFCYNYYKFFIQYLLFPSIIFIAFFLTDKPELDKSLFFILILLFLGGYYFSLRYVWEKPNKYILTVIFFILLTIAFGLSFINLLTGEKRIDFPLNNCYDNYKRVGEINCYDLLNHVIVGNKVSCRIKIINNDIALPDKGTVKFTFLNGNEKLVEIFQNDDYSFVVPKDIGITYFEFKDNRTCLSVSSSSRYPDYAEYKEDKNNFMYLFLALFGFCFISVPIIVKNFYQFKDEKKKPSY